jgi:hypothetical protein
MQLCRLLSCDPLTVDDVRRELGELPVPAAVEPEPGTDAPAFVLLRLPESCQLTLDALKEAFGSYSQLPRLHRQAPDEFIIYVESPGTPYTCALVVEQKQDGSAIQSVTIRRDIRLD